MSQELRNKVQGIISISNEPVNPENISKHLDIAWATALRYALELVIESRIHGLRTSNGWVFWSGKNE